ncbi:hypothetical protein AB1Y20_007177 [Prymnesium parvum]|uniref:AB hydrolase-1 domain-containing protein n=1 Tax=Prymnesium parvum TaxID=97485 RepID=A0AB34IUI8_PRYPA
MVALHLIAALLPALAPPLAPAPAPRASTSSAPLAYELLRGTAPSASRHTCVLLHGILGSGRNLRAFASRLCEEFPEWQCLLVDLRCHGRTASTHPHPPGPHTVESAALDVIGVLRHLGIYPEMLLGHSFGGKVVMSMIEQTRGVLPRRLQAWVLDTVPGDVYVEGGDHPKDTIQFVRTLRMPLSSRKELVDQLTAAGFSTEGAHWMATNLKPEAGGGLGWAFDLEGIAEMYESYERTDLWPWLKAKPKLLDLDFVRAERSAFVWTDEDLRKMEEVGSHVHFLRDSSHWVHIDNPDGLIEILAPSFRRLT